MVIKPNVVNTSVKVDRAKWEAIKTRGYKLQDLVDKVFDEVLDIEDLNPTELLENREQLLKEKQLLEQRKKDRLKELEVSAQELETLIEAETSKYNKKIKSIDLSLKLISEDIINEKKELEEKKQLQVRKDDLMVLSKSLKAVHGNYKRDEFQEELSEYCNKYGLSKEEVLTGFGIKPKNINGSINDKKE